MAKAHPDVDPSELQRRGCQHQEALLPRGRAGSTTERRSEPAVSLALEGIIPLTQGHDSARVLLSGRLSPVFLGLLGLS